MANSFGTIDHALLGAISGGIVGTVGTVETVDSSSKWARPLSGLRNLEVRKPDAANIDAGIVRRPPHGDIDAGIVRTPY